jgi:NAD(P)-dependent dehydrogenase (short-subunit alcohol dehydrogenase family)
MKMNILITGASGNLGKAAVEKFLAEGYNVIATVSPGKNLGFEVTGDVQTMEADLTNEKSVEEVIIQVVNKFQTIDAALLLVGAFAAGGIRETDGAALKRMYTLNFETAYFAARPIFLQMEKQKSGGRIILVGARPSLLPVEGKDFLAYGLSKSLLFKLAEYMNAEGSSKNIVTSVLVPGVIDTPINRKSNPTANFTDWVKPEEIAELMALLSAEKGKALRETVLKIYGNS